MQSRLTHCSLSALHTYKRHFLTHSLNNWRRTHSSADLDEFAHRVDRIRHADSAYTYISQP